MKATERTFNNFVITICDQNLNPIYAIDNNVLITLLKRFPNMKRLKYRNFINKKQIFKVKF